MAHGLPDYYRGVDIAYQALSQMIVRPKYGGALLSEGSVTVTDGVLTQLVQINGKGMLYGGAVWLDDTLTQANSEVWLQIDFSLFASPSFYRLLQYGMTDPRSNPVSLNIFNAMDYIYCVGLSYGITFETRIDIRYYEKYGRTPKVFWRLLYALV